MNNLWRELRTGPDCPEIVSAIVEIPKGARNKLEYNIESGVIVLNRVLFSSLHYTIRCWLCRRPIRCSPTTATWGTSPRIS